MITHTLNIISGKPRLCTMTPSMCTNIGSATSTTSSSFISCTSHPISLNAICSKSSLSTVICEAATNRRVKKGASSTSDSSMGGAEGSATGKSKTTYLTWDVTARHGGFRNKDGKLLHTKMLPLPSDSEVITVEIQIKDIARILKALSKYRDGVPESVKSDFWSIVDNGEQLDFSKQDLIDLFPGNTRPESPPEALQRDSDGVFIKGYLPDKSTSSGPKWEEDNSFFSDLQSAATEDQSKYVAVGDDRKGAVLGLYAPYSDAIPEFLLLQKAQGSLMERNYTKLYKTHNSALLELHVLSAMKNFGPSYYGPQGEAVIFILDFLQYTVEAISIVAISAHGTPSNGFKLCEDHEVLNRHHENFGSLLRKGPDSASAAAIALANDTKIPEEVKKTILRDGLLAALSGLGGDSFSSARSWIKEAVSERVDATRSVGSIYPSLPAWLKESIVDYASHRTAVKNFMSMVTSCIKSTFPEETSAVRKSMEKNEPILRAHLLACKTDVWTIVFTETSAFVEPGTKVRVLIDTKIEEARGAGWMVSDLNVLRAQYETDAANVIRSSLLEKVDNAPNRQVPLGDLPPKIQYLLRSTTASREDLSIRELYAPLGLDFTPFS